MKQPTQHWEALDKLILVAGHAVYISAELSVADRDENWVLKDFQKGEPPRYIEHIRFGVELAESQPKSLLVFSGGQTRLEACPRSEARSYYLLADQFGWWQKTDVQERATTEEFARDSFENLLFSIARFRECTAHYPNSIEIISWAFKRDRFDLHRQTLRWPGDVQHYKYHGVNNPDDLDGSLKGEAKTLAAFDRDPFGTAPYLQAKRTRRNPFHRQHPYAESCPEIANLLNSNPMNRETAEDPLPWAFSNSNRDGRSI